MVPTSPPALIAFCIWSSRARCATGNGAGLCQLGGQFFQLLSAQKPAVGADQVVVPLKRSALFSASCTRLASSWSRDVIEALTRFAASARARMSSSMYALATPSVIRGALFGSRLTALIATT